MLRIPQSSSLTKALPSDPYEGHSLGKFYPSAEVQSVYSTVPGEDSTWHKILGHCNYDDIVKLPNVVDGMKIKGRDTSNRVCGICIKGKFSQNRTQATSVLQLVHTDQARPIEAANLNGNRYAVSFTDDFSGAVFVYFTKNKGDPPSATEKFADSSPYGTIKKH